MRETETVAEVAEVAEVDGRQGELRLWREKVEQGGGGDGDDDVTFSPGLFRAMSTPLSWISSMVYGTTTVAVLEAGESQA